MGKKSIAQKAKKVATDTVKNLDPEPETPISGSEPVGSKIKSNKKGGGSVRRSGRLQSVIKSAVKNQDIEVEQIDLEESEKEEETHVESEKEDEPLVEAEQTPVVSEPRNENLYNAPKPTPNHLIQDERVDHFIKAVQGLKSKGAQVHVSSESSSVSLIYKSLYLDSQKKIEALNSENHELARKLEIALAKLEVFENKAVNISNLEKAIEALVRPASYFGGHFSSKDGDTDEAGGGGVAKELSAKKRRY